MKVSAGLTVVLLALTTSNFDFLRQFWSLLVVSSFDDVLLRGVRESRESRASLAQLAPNLDAGANAPG